MAALESTITGFYKDKAAYSVDKTAYSADRAHFYETLKCLVAGMRKVEEAAKNKDEEAAKNKDDRDKIEGLVGRSVVCGRMLTC
jgi:hypothetical protein